MKGTPLTEKTWQYICDLVPAEDEFLRKLNEDALAQEIPAIQISPDQVSFLQFFLKSIQAKNVLEIGSLAGYSTITMARALPEDGKLFALEREPEYSYFIREKVKEAQLDHIVSVHTGEALDTLKTEQFPQLDFVFIDADKLNYSNYLELVMPMLRVGGVVCGDNALAWGMIADKDVPADREDVLGMQEFNRAMASRDDLSCSMIPLGDGMFMGVKTK